MCRQLSEEVQAYTGTSFPIFDDNEDIGWGEHVEQSIANAIAGVMFFIPILTPSFFKTQSCCDKLQRFWQREQQLQRNDLILPIYYMTCDVLKDPKEKTKDKLAQIFENRKFVDWRNLRFKSLSDPLAREELARMAEQIQEALKRISVQSPIASTHILPQVNITGVQQQFSTIEEIVHEVPAIHNVVKEYRDEFASIWEQINRVSNYKTLHDYLHQIEFGCYFHMTYALRNPNDESFSFLQSIALELEEIVGKAKYIIQRKLSATEVEWIGNLETAHKTLENVIEDKNMQQLQITIWHINRVLAIHPSRINTRLHEAAETLRLSVLVLVEAMVTIHDSLHHSGYDDTKHNALQTAIKQLNTLNTNLTALVKAHNDS